MFLCCFNYFSGTSLCLRALLSRREQIEILEGIAGINITGLYLPAPVGKMVLVLL